MRPLPLLHLSGRVKNQRYVRDEKHGGIGRGLAVVIEDAALNVPPAFESHNAIVDFGRSGGGDLFEDRLRHVTIGQIRARSPPSQSRGTLKCP